MRFSRTLTLAAAVCFLAAGCHHHKAHDHGDNAARRDPKDAARAFLQAGHDGRWDRTAELSRYPSRVIQALNGPWPGDGVQCPAEVRDSWRVRVFQDWDYTVGDIVYLPVQGAVLALAPVGGARDSGRSVLVALERKDDGAWAVCDLVRMEQIYIDQLSSEPPPELTPKH